LYCGSGVWVHRFDQQKFAGESGGYFSSDRSSYGYGELAMDGLCGFEKYRYPASGCSGVGFDHPVYCVAGVFQYTCKKRRLTLTEKTFFPALAGVTVDCREFEKFDKNFLPQEKKIKVIQLR